MVLIQDARSNMKQCARVHYGVANRRAASPRLRCRYYYHSRKYRDFVKLEALTFNIDSSQYFQPRFSCYHLHHPHLLNVFRTERPATSVGTTRHPFEANIVCRPIGTI